MPISLGMASDSIPAKRCVSEAKCPHMLTSRLKALGDAGKGNGSHRVPTPTKSGAGGRGGLATRFVWPSRLLGPQATTIHQQVTSECAFSPTLSSHLGRKRK